ncbi:MAG: hypothetical protein ACI835_001329 [Planctomycetota bacterium]|jgi:hypothetical protein
MSVGLARARWELNQVTPDVCLIGWPSARARSADAPVMPDQLTLRVCLIS